MSNNERQKARRVFSSRENGERKRTKGEEEDEEELEESVRGERKKVFGGYDGWSETKYRGERVL